MNAINPQEVLGKGGNVIKTRDDHDLILLILTIRSSMLLIVIGYLMTMIAL